MPGVVAAALEFPVPVIEPGKFAVEDVVSDHAEGVDIPAFALAVGEIAVAQLFRGGEVAGVADFKVMDARDQALGEVAEANHLGFVALVFDEDVPRLDAGVDDVEPVEEGEGVDELFHEAPGQGGRELAGHFVQGGRFSVEPLVVVGDVIIGSLLQVEGVDGNQIGV
jgi:hypothetical protein